MNTDAFREALLRVMDAKTHWAWPAFTSGAVAADRLHLHLEQEYAVYVRDFPILVGRAYVQCPIPAVRQDLAENLYEEETGGIAAGKPHPELFLEYPRGLGMDLARFEDVTLLPAAHAYRSWLDNATQRRGWAIATALVTLWIEGNAHDRSLFESQVPPRPEPRLEDHPLVKHYGLDIAHLALTKAHRAVEGDHRVAAWRMILDHTPVGDRDEVVQAMTQACALWKGYRDDVAEACGVDRA
jgi:pyrroloquinoline quinone (PQQ) biosynthesis protein C